MAVIALTTFRDLVRHTLDFLGADAGEEGRRTARRAAINAYRDLGSAHKWSYYYHRGRLSTVAPQSTGTVQYTHTGGTYERMLALTGATWPSWAAYGTVVISNIAYEVAERKSSSVITLTTASNPGSDVAAGAGYNLYRDTYPLPADCLSIDKMILINNAWCLSYEHPGAWLERQQIYRGQATPRTYTIRGDPNYFGTLAISFFPAPDQAYALDFLYQRRPRALLLEEYSTGTASVISGGSTATGSGTAWTSNMVGSVIRLSGDRINLPDPPTGPYPAAQERVITAVASATSLTVDTAWDQTLSSVKHIVSDPVDIEEGAMLSALWRGCERQAAIGRARKDRDVIEAEYRTALIMAREADSRNFAEETAGPARPYPARLADFPAGPDVS